MPAFVLCDPALLMPAPANEEEAARFWGRLIEWSTDHRLRLGPAGNQMVITLLGNLGWPKREVGSFPPGMAQLAYRALATLLGQTLIAETKTPAPTLTPGYRGNKQGEAAIGADAAALYERLHGLATDRAHWDEESERVRFEPPPPDSLSLLFEPNMRLAEEVDHAVRRYLKRRRITIIGGIASDRTVEELSSRFAPKEIRWFGAEPGSRLNLDGLEGLQARLDVVYCVTSHIGHDGSIKAKQRCSRRGLELRKIATANEIAADLCRRHGGD